MDNIIKTIYEDLVSIPHQILSIFEQHYGSDRVEMQNLIVLDNIRALISTPISNILLRNNLVIPDHFPKGVSFDTNNMFLKDQDTFDLFYEQLKDKIKAYYTTNINIIIKFGDVTISNEDNDEYLLRDLWGKVSFNYFGRLNGTFGLLRSTHTSSELLSEYSHSHVSGTYTHFSSPCLGSGPINDTIAKLIIEYDEHFWMLFAYEIDKFTQVESLQGGPYLSFLDIKVAGLREENIKFIDFNKKTLPFNVKTYLKSAIDKFPFMKNFIKELIPKIPFTIINNRFFTSLTPSEYINLVTNLFIDYVNTNLNSSFNTEFFIREGLLNRGILHQDRIVVYNNEEITHDSDYPVDTFLFDFKGESIRTNIIERNNNDLLEKPVFLEYNTLLSILDRITLFLNINYESRREIIPTSESSTLIV